MGRKTNDFLFQLIKSLDPSEKGHFKRFVSQNIIGKTNQSVLLFDLIAKQETYDEQKILENGKFNKSAFPTLKRYLYSILLKSLESYNSGIAESLQSSIRHIELLTSKNLFTLASKELKRAKKLALTFEEYPYLLKIMEWELRIANRESHKNITKEGLNQLFHEMEDSIKIYGRGVALKRELHKWIIEEHKDGVPRKGNGLKKQEEEILRLSEEESLSFEEKDNLFYLKAHILNSIGEFDKSYAYYKREWSC